MTSNFVRELNIGNYIATEGGHLPYWRISKDDLVTILQSEKQEIYKPVILSEEWLLKDCIKNENGNMDFTHKEYPFIRVCLCTDNKFRLILNLQDDLLEEPLLEYVHSWQNIFFALTQKELQLK